MIKSELESSKEHIKEILLFAEEDLNQLNSKLLKKIQKNAV